MALSSAQNQSSSSAAEDVSEVTSLLRSFTGAFVFVVVFSMFINLLMLVPPLYMLQVYDRVLVSRSESTLLMLTIIVVMLFITMGLLELVRSRVLSRIGASIETRMSARVYEAMFRLSLVNPAMTHAQALEDLRNIRVFVVGRALTALVDLPWVPIFIAILFVFHPLYGAFGIFAVAILLGLAFVNEWSTKGPLQESNSQAVLARTIAASQTRNAEVVQAMGLTERLRQRWMEVYDEYLLNQSRAADRAGTWMTLSRNLRLLFQSLMLGIGALLAIKLEVTAGMIIAGSIILGRALAPLDQLIANWKQGVAAGSSLKRLRELLSNFPEDRERMPLPDPTGHLSVVSMVVVPPGSEQTVLRGVTFELQPGESLGVVGPSGAGKSSLARGLLGVWPLAAGKVRLDGAELSQWARHALGRHIGYLPQDIELFSGTVAENIARFEEAETEAVVEAARLVGVHDLILHLANGYNTQIGPGGAALSAGQRQRLGLARAVFRTPKFVVLDEPNSNLDDAGEAALAATISRLKESGTTVVIISHRVGILLQMDKVLVLREGVVVRFGEREDVMRAAERGQSGPSSPALAATASPKQAD